MSRRKQRGGTQTGGAAAPTATADNAARSERWPQPTPRRWQIVLSAACVLAWLAFLLYLALAYGD